MRLTFLLSILLVTGTAAGLSHDATPRLPQDPDRPAADRSEAGTPKPAPGSLLLAVRVDAQGVHVLQAVRKPDLEFVPSKRAARAGLGWTMRNARGEAIADGGFDVGHLDLDPTHAGRPARVARGRIVSTQAFTVVKVPALADFAAIEFTRRAPGATLPFGVARAASLPVR